MRNRLFWILMTYVERPLFWVLSLAALGVWLYFLPTGEKHYSTCHPELTLRRGAVFDLNTLERLLHADRASDVTDIAFDRLWNDAFRVAIQTPHPGERPPGIEGAQQAAAERLAELADLPNLKRVTFTRRSVIITGNGRPIQPGLPLQTLDASLKFRNWHCLSWALTTSLRMRYSRSPICENFARCNSNTSNHCPRWRSSPTCRIWRR